MARLNLQIGGGDPEEYARRKVERELARDKAIDELMDDLFYEEVVTPALEGKAPPVVRQQIQEEVVYREPRTNVDVLANYITKSVREEPQEPKSVRSLRETYSLEDRLTLLEQDFFAKMAQGNPGTLVAGIGASLDSGGGAVWLWDLEDVNIGTPMNGTYPAINDGATLVYDASENQWVPGTGTGGVDSSLTQGGIIQKDGGESNNTGNLIIRSANGSTGILKIQASDETTNFQVTSGGGITQTGKLDLGLCIPTDTSKETLPAIKLENGAPKDSNTTPRITLLNTRTKTPANGLVDDVAFRRYNLDIAAGRSNSIRIQRGDFNGGWAGLYIEGKTTTYDPNAAGSADNPNNDPKKYPLVYLYRSNSTGTNGENHVADLINYRGKTDGTYTLQNKQSVQELISSGGGGVTFLLQGTCNVTIAPDDALQPETITEQEGYYYINDTAGTANAGWTGLGGLNIPGNTLIFWSSANDRWVAGAVADPSTYLLLTAGEANKVTGQLTLQKSSNSGAALKVQNSSNDRVTELMNSGAVNVGEKLTVSDGNSFFNGSVNINADGSATGTSTSAKLNVYPPTANTSPINSFDVRGRGIRPSDNSARTSILQSYIYPALDENGDPQNLQDYIVYYGRTNGDNMLQTRYSVQYQTELFKTIGQNYLLSSTGASGETTPSLTIRGGKSNSLTACLYVA